MEAQPCFSPSELDEPKWPDIWRKKVLCCNPKSEEDTWPDINTRCVMCGGKFVEDVCCLTRYGESRMGEKHTLQE